MKDYNTIGLLQCLFHADKAIIRETSPINEKTIVEIHEQI